MAEGQAISRAGRSAAVTVAGGALLILSIVHAAIAALYAIVLSLPSRAVLRIGDIALWPDFALSGALFFLLLCLLSGYAGLAAIFQWRDWQLVAQIAGWTMIAVGAYVFWIYLRLFIPDLPVPPIPLVSGLGLSPYVSLVPAVIGIFVLWSIRKPTEKNP